MIFLESVICLTIFLKASFFVLQHFSVLYVKISNIHTNILEKTYDILDYLLPINIYIYSSFLIIELNPDEADDFNKSNFNL